MPESVTLPAEAIRDLHLSEGDRVEATVEVLRGIAVISVTPHVPAKEPARSPVWPDFDAEVREIFGDRKIPGPNPILEARNQSQW